VVLHWVNALVHSAKLLEECLAKRGVHDRLPTPPPTPWPLRTFFFFSTLKKELAGSTLTPEEFKKEWGQLLRETTKEEFASTFTRWLEHCEK
jgi:hypothetical protein